MIRDLISRIKRVWLEPSECEALVTHLEFMKANHDSLYFLEKKDNALATLFVMHRPQREFFVRYHQHLSFDTTRKVTRY